MIQFSNLYRRREGKTPASSSIPSPTTGTFRHGGGGTDHEKQIHVHHVTQSTGSCQAFIQGCFNIISRLGRLSGADSRQDWIKLTT